MIPSLNDLLFRLVAAGKRDDAIAIQRTVIEIRDLPVTYNCPTQEA